MYFQPLSDRILIERLEPADKTKGGIFIPDTAKEKPVEGRVMATGPGTWVDGKFREVQVKRGDKVLFSKYGGTEIKLEGEDGEFLVVREDDILGIIAK